jgi:flagellum-specific ATP synthase
MTYNEELLAINNKLFNIPEERFCGTVASVKGILIKCTGLNKYLGVGYKCHIETRSKGIFLAEVIGFEGEYALLMLFDSPEDIGVGCKVYYQGIDNLIYPHEKWRGRILDALGNPLDDKGVLLNGDKAYKLKNKPLNAYRKNRVGKKIDLGVKAINCFASCCEGQRMGIFAGSGVGKSVLISMLTKYADFDIKVIGLIGERGREVQEFVQDYLGENGLQNAVVVVSTSDQAALMRRQATYLTLSIAEYFRDEGKKVLCIIDSVTRFAMAQREIGLAIGEPPSSKGYTPAVFSELPQLLERAGPGIGTGSITGLFSVLVENDDMNDPIADAVRGIVDGHIVLDRSIADKGRFPAINISRTLSRTMPGCNTDYENNVVNLAKKYIDLYLDIEDMVKIGAYRKGSDKNTDLAIHYYPLIEKFLKQLPNEKYTLGEGYKELAQIIGYSE